MCIFVIHAELGAYSETMQPVIGLLTPLAFGTAASILYLNPQ